MLKTSLPGPSLLIIVVEFWERFSYYGLMAIFVLFLSAAPSTGGFGWTLSSSLLLMSVFTGLAWCSPIIGGVISDRYLGSRRSIFWGAISLTLGNLALVFALLLPALAGWILAAPIAELLRAAHVPLGNLLLNTSQEHLLIRAAAAVRDQTALLSVYRAQGWLFYSGLALVVVGNALLKSTLPVLLGEVFAAYGGRSDAAYSYYYMAITLGGLTSSVAVGYLAQQFGWATGLACAALGMVIALGLFVLLGPHILGSLGLQRTRLVESAANVENVSPHAEGGLFRIAIYGIFLIIFSIGWCQYGGLWIYAIETQVQRSVMGFTVPTPWLLGLYTLLVSVYSPIYAAASRRIVKWRGVEPSYGSYFVLGFLIMAAAHGVMAAGFALAHGAPVSILWPVAAMVIMPVADVLVWPSSYGMVQRFSPTRIRSAILGAWIGMLGLGQFFAHAAAAVGAQWGFSRFSGCIAVLMLVGAALLWIVDRKLQCLQGLQNAGLSSTERDSMG